jgi:GT2 family glycosyltransferase
LVTRNRQRLLTECLAAIDEQTYPVERVVIVDNASDDGTEAWLREEAPGLLEVELDVVRSATNVGGSGGFAMAIDRARGGDFDWLWLMDDDAEPMPDALGAMLDADEASLENTVGLCSTVRHPDGTIDLQHRCRHERFVVPLPETAYAPGTRAAVDCASFVGLLVRAEAARRTDLPRREFFLGYDDAEWSIRLRRLGEIRLVPESVVLHKVPIGGAERGSRSAFWNRLLGIGYASAPWKTYWKDLYRLRNLVALQRAHGDLRRAGLVVLVVGYVVKAVLYDAAPLRRVPWIVRYAVKGWDGDFVAPSPAQWAAGPAVRRMRPSWR